MESKVVTETTTVTVNLRVARVLCPGDLSRARLILW